VKRRTKPVIRLAGRITAAAIVLIVSTIVGVQFARAIGENVGAARELSSLHSDIKALQTRRVDQERELSRLHDPEGAVPEIHDRLRLVRPNETIIFVSPQPAASPQE
jgi:cell division protein FtsB